MRSSARPHDRRRRAGGLSDQVRFACAKYIAPSADGARVVAIGAGDGVDSFALRCAALTAR